MILSSVSLKYNNPQHLPYLHLLAFKPMKYFLIILCLLHCTTNVFSKAIHVGKNQLYKSINAAISSADAGDTVLVDAGLYLEKSISINKKIVLKGINYPVLDGEKKYEIISIKADGVIIEGFIPAYPVL